MKPELMEKYVVRPTLAKMQSHDPRMLSDSAVKLIMGTIAQESDMGAYQSQIGGGPGTGVCSVEKATEHDIRTRYLLRHPELRRVLDSIVVPQEDIRTDQYYWAQLESNYAYCVFMARIKYWMVPDPLPDANNIYALGEYWDINYNINASHGTAEEFVESYNYFVLGKR